MASVHLLHELLNEDQEPFLPPHYISHNRYMFHKKAPPVSNYRRRRRFSSLIFSKLCTNLCFFSFTPSALPPTFDFYEFSSSPITPCTPPPSTLLRHIPARTAAPLLQAALGIHNYSPHTTTSHYNNHEHKNRHPASASSLIYSILKKITPGTRTKRCKTKDNCLKDSLMGLHSSSSPKWENSDKSSSQQYSLSLEGDGVFSVQNFFSPVQPTPCRRRNLDEEEAGADGLSKPALADEKEQCSPVSVLDPTLKEDEREEETYGEEEVCYSSIERRKRHLLQKLQEFDETATCKENGCDMVCEKEKEEDIEVGARKKDNSTIDMMVEKKMEEESEGGLWKWRRLKEEECHDTIEVAMSVVDLLVGELSWELLQQECFERSR